MHMHQRRLELANIELVCAYSGWALPPSTLERFEVLLLIAWALELINCANSESLVSSATWETSQRSAPHSGQGHMAWHAGTTRWKTFKHIRMQTPSSRDVTWSRDHIVHRTLNINHRIQAAGRHGAETAIPTVPWSTYHLLSMYMLRFAWQYGRQKESAGLGQIFRINVST